MTEENPTHATSQSTVHTTRSKPLSAGLRAAVGVTAAIDLIIGLAFLFAVALVYGIVVLVALLYHLLLGDAALFFWLYAVVDAIFLGPIAYLYWRYERS